MTTIHNFSAGPAALAKPVRERLADTFGLDRLDEPSVAEISHRGPAFIELAEQLEAGLRTLMGIDDNHAVLLLQGGAQHQFAMLPMNLAHQRTPTYVITGHWGEQAFEESSRITKTMLAASNADIEYLDLPELGHLPGNCAYLHYTGNETIHGVQYEQPPSAGLPLVADLSSEFLSRPYPYIELGVAYASAQKNLGIAGLTVVVIRRDLLERIPDGLPKMLDYRTWVRTDSMQNTPCTVAWYVALETVRWIESIGGLAAMGQRNQAKAAALYAAIDQSDFYANAVHAEARSIMNVPFVLAEPDRTMDFVQQAEQAGMPGLKGHRAVGGLRASLYNALEQDAVTDLMAFMQEFERTAG
ncbi:MAG: 3-phosphoserine/phosphohydroxythreonine transaminase [Pseudomonadota bacterium]